MQDETQYQHKYKHLKKESIALVKHLILDKKFFRQDEVNKLILLDFLNKELCKIYNTKEICKIKIDTYNDGYFNFFNGIIALSHKVSLITFLHEFKHFLQTQRNKENSEEIARGWSISLFFQASPKHFFRALNKGLILHQKTLSNLFADYESDYSDEIK